MIKVYLVDDNEIERLQQMSCLVGHTDYVIVGQHHNPLQAIEEINKLQPDVLILDIEMPELNGIDMFKSLTHKPQIILSTSHLEFALEAFALDAIDYIIKPVTKERLLKAMEKAHIIVAAHREKSLSHIEISKDYIFVKDKYKLVKVNLNEITYIESMGDFVQIYLENKTKMLVLVNLKNIESQLPSENFIRISRMSLVAINKIKSINHNEIEIANVTLTIGKQFADELLLKVVGNKTIKRHA
jgi:two-component system, LytTR family, response regulator